MTPLPHLLGRLPNQRSVMQLKALTLVKMMRYLPSLMFAGLLGMTGCGRAPEPPARAVASAAPSTNQRTYQAKGVVVAVKPREKSVEIKHEEIPNFRSEERRVGKE